MAPENEPLVFDISIEELKVKGITLKGLKLKTTFRPFKELPEAIQKQALELINKFYSGI